jgi:formamidopyrimidine-DNA glycosylase
MVAKFYFKDGSLLTHNSVRKFGSFELTDKENLSVLDASLGPEPLSKEFTLQKLSELLQKKKNSALKTTLMDQHFLSGLGNIYSQEALYYAGIKPHRKIGALSSAEIKKLHDAILKVLNEGIKHKGASVDNYVSLEGEGTFQEHLAVYQQDHCPKKHPLKKEVIGGRGTSYCPVCQK